jgi:hypothetical protein
MTKFSKLFLGKGYLKTAFIILAIGLIGYFVIRGMGLKEGATSNTPSKTASKTRLSKTTSKAMCTALCGGYGNTPEAIESCRKKC